MPTDFHGLFATLEARKLRYVVVGGLALVLHGVDRLTADIDLAVDLAPEAAAILIATLLAAGYRPAAPVDARLFADPATRAAWRRERGMQAFGGDPGRLDSTSDSAQGGGGSSAGRCRYSTSACDPGTQG